MKYLFFILSIGLMLITCQSQPQSGTIAIDIEQCELRSTLESTGATLIDIRTPDEVAQGIIEGADVVNFRGPDFIKSMEQHPKNQPLVIYCAAGGRSAKAMKMLNNAGWKEVYNLLGGYGEYVPN